MKLLLKILILSSLVFPGSSFAQFDYSDDEIEVILSGESESDEFEDLRERRVKKKKIRKKKKKYKKRSKKRRRRKKRKPKKTIEPEFEAYGEISSNDDEEKEFGFDENSEEESGWERSPRGGEFFLGLKTPDLKRNQLSGEVSFEGRAFEKKDPTGETVDQSVGVFIRLEQPFESSSGVWSAKARGFARVGAIDSGRNLIVPEDVWVAYEKGFSQWKFGFQTFNWTQMDIFQPAELLNSVNFDGEIENLEKIGELALTLKMKLSFGFLQAIYMPLVFKSHFPSGKSRFSILDAGQEMGDLIFVKKDGTLVESNQFHQFAFHFSKSLETFDLNLFFVDQVDRRGPVVVFQNSSDSFRPVYFPITTFGGNFLYPNNGWVLKGEAARRLVTNPAQPTIFGELQKKSHSFAALGVEREFSVKSWTVTGFVEYQKLFGLSQSDDEENLEIELQKLSAFQNDIAFGARVSFNDLQGRELRLLVDVDLDRSDQILASVTYRQRVKEVWEVKAGYRYITAPQTEAIAVGLELFDQDNYGFLQVTRFF